MKDETGPWRKFIMCGFIICTPHQILLCKMTQSRRMRRAGHVASMTEKCIQGFDCKTWRKNAVRKT
jgi:hypothetical protein